MATVNQQQLNYLVTQILTAIRNGLNLDIQDPDAIGQYVCSIIALGADLIPEIGTSLGALCNLFGAVVFNPNSMENIWNALSKRIEALIDEKIEEYYLGTLKQTIIGFQNNLDLYGQYLKNFEDATSDEKGKAADTLKMEHIAFLTVLIAGIPEFQLDAYAVASLPLFALVATMHLTLLADGIKRGQDWGYTDDNIATMQQQFKALTSPAGSSDSVLNAHKSPRDILLPGSMVKDAINKGVKAGVPTEVLDTWNKAYATLYEPGKPPGNGYEGLDYVTYAKQTCVQGRQMVKQEGGDNYQGYRDATNYKACSDYDTNMVLNVLNYAELWPFMAGDEWTETAIRNVDREIFYGPYERWADGAKWTLSSPPPITDRGDPLTGVYVRGWDDIDGVQVKHGSSWDSFQGNSSGGAPKELDLASDEFVNGVIVYSGFKLGCLEFATNKGNGISVGSARHGSNSTTIKPPGYELTSVTITQWSGDTPTGCEGVILGFRPLITDPNSYQD